MGYVCRALVRVSNFSRIPHFYKWGRFKRYNSKRFGREMEHFDLLMGQTYVREAILAGKSAKEISAMWQEDVRRFKEQRRPYLLYAE
ncbi:exo-beta-N-acetylmuramidase NamZ domain-containing protein [Selenomonas ruminantium]|uniref:exo-beta-N-acetylmuramidase NamZ domain-containing protein n=1 Tax=Selenomonas ruminantium TaxID=971 RepID=UPI0023504580|nr:exo-beta-N-acetylmuramidase NamZ domain-containing protein [Selenomonas ruminantium]